MRITSPSFDVNWEDEFRALLAESGEERQAEIIADLKLSSANPVNSELRAIESVARVVLDDLRAARASAQLGNLDQDDERLAATYWGDDPQVYLTLLREASYTHVNSTVDSELNERLMLDRSYGVGGLDNGFSNLNTDEINLIRRYGS